MSEEFQKKEAVQVDNIIVRIARRLAWTTPISLYGGDYDQLHEELQEELHDTVRAILKDLRNPTMKMRKAGEKYTGFNYADNCWQDMIDVALEDGVNPIYKEDL